VANQAAIETAQLVDALQVAATRPLVHPDIDHRILGLVVHGIGEQKVGGTLHDVVQHFLPFIRNTGIDPHASVSARPLDEGDPSEVVIQFTDRRSGSRKGKRYEMRIMEVWWANTFSPPTFGKFVTGLLDFAPRFSFLRRWLWFMPKGVECRARSSPAILPIWGWRPGDPVFWQRFLVDWLALVLIVPTALLLMLLAVLEAGKVLLYALPAWIKEPQRLLVNIATRQAGDALVYIQDSWDASRGRVRFEQRFYQITEVLGPPKNTGNCTADCGADSVFVIGHSLGSVVVYEALTGRRLTERIEKKFPEGGPRLFFFSVGSALNTAWDFSTDREEHRFSGRLCDRVHWTDIYSEHDPVPRGPLRPPERGRDGVVPRPPDESLPVVNQMDVFADHLSYWNNAEQVIAGMFNTVMPEGFDPVQLNTGARVRRVKWLSAAKALAYVAALATGLALSLGGSAGGAADWLMRGFADGDAWRCVAGAIISFAGAAAVVVALYLLVIKSLWNRIDRAAKYRPLPGNASVPPHIGV
jgi:hypothetical protein